MAKQPVVLIIRDGWGINPDGKAKAEQNGDATLLAHTPFHNQVYETYPFGQLSASGMDVGLPDGQMGNSEVGHLNLGAGRIVYQDLTRINKTIADKKLASIPTLAETFEKAKKSRLHLIGLVSDGGVHSHQDHLIALAQTAREAGVSDILVHAITDGRDTSPTGGEQFLRTCEDALGKVGVPIATVVGRYYAMDRDKRWERTKLAWDAIVLGKGTHQLELPSEAVAACYENEGKTDEFLHPMVFTTPGERLVRNGDVVLFFNFRADRARQLSEAFLKPDFAGFDREGDLQVEFVTLTEYDETYGCPAVFPPETLSDTLGEVVSRQGKKQIRLAETEKYPHVTYFFNGGVEMVNPGEDRIIVPSPKEVATYDLKPEMSAPELTEKLLAVLPEYDLVILNFANPDMVGHTGVVEAAIHAVETIDSCVQRIVEATLALDGKLILTADHGNCEFMRNADGSPHTAHTTNPVHCIYVANDHDQWEMKSGILADIAPTLLDMMGLSKPTAMTGQNLRVAKEIPL